MSTFTNKIKQYRDLAATTGGNLTIESGIFTPGTNLPVDDFVSYRVTGTKTLSSDLDIVINGVLLSGVCVEILWEAVITPSGNNVTIFGKTVPEELVSKNFVAECRYNGTSWTVAILPDFAATSIVNADRIEADAVTTAKIANDAVTLAKMASGTTGSILAYNASGNIEEASMAADGKLLIGVTAGKGYTTAVLSGDATISTAGAMTIANNAITTAKITDANVTVEKCEADLLYDMISVRIDSKSAAAVGNVNITMPYKCNVTHVVIGVLEPTLNDTFTAVLKDNGGASMGSIDIPTSLAIGNKATLASSGSPLSSNNAFTRSQNLLIECSKTTKSSGAYNVCIYTIRT